MDRPANDLSGTRLPVVMARTWSGRLTSWGRIGRRTWRPVKALASLADDRRTADRNSRALRLCPKGDGLDRVHRSMVQSPARCKSEDTATAGQPASAPKSSTSWGDSFGPAAAAADWDRARPRGGRSPAAGREQPRAATGRSRLASPIPAAPSQIRPRSRPTTHRRRSQTRERRACPGWRAQAARAQARRSPR